MGEYRLVEKSHPWHACIFQSLYILFTFDNKIHQKWNQGREELSWSSSSPEQSSSIPNWFVKSTRARWDVGAKIRLNLPRATSLLIPMNQDTSSNIKCRGSRKTANYRWPRYLSTSISINGEAGGGTGWSRVWILRDREWEQRPGIDGCGTSRMWGQVWPGSLVRQCHGTMPWL